MPVIIDPNAEITTLNKNPSQQPLTVNNSLALLSSSATDFQKDIAKLPNIQHGEKDSVHWIESVVKATEHVLNGDVFKRILADPDSTWTNRPTYDDKPLTAGKLKQNDSTGIVSGEAAVMKIKARLGLGSIVPIPLWHTGGWLTLKAPSNASIFELNRRISQEKVTLGRLTNGMIFSNTGVYIQSYLINFILAHVYDTTFGTKDTEELKSIILSTDMPSLVWGIVCAMYPDGYNLVEPCVAQITKCNHVAEGKVNIARLRVVDTSKISEGQMKHMSRRNGTHSAAELEKYQSEFKFAKRNVDIEGGDGMSIDMAIPTIAEFEAVGFNWVDSLVNMVDSAFRVPLKGGDRDQYITEQGRLASLRQYSHWIDAIQMSESKDGDVISDRDTIDTICSDFSADEVIRTSILNSIGTYIEECTIAVIGYPNIECPSCDLRYGDSMVESETAGVEDEIVRGDNVPEFIPMDLTTTFFTLCGQRIQPTINKAL
jgi:hypothetical protein